MARTANCSCGWTVVLPDPPSGSPQITRTSAPIGTSGSTVASDSALRSLAL